MFQQRPDLTLNNKDGEFAWNISRVNAITLFYTDNIQNGKARARTWYYCNYQRHAVEFIFRGKPSLQQFVKILLRSSCLQDK